MNRILFLTIVHYVVSEVFRYVPFLYLSEVFRYVPSECPSPTYVYTLLPPPYNETLLNGQSHDPEGDAAIDAF